MSLQLFNLKGKTALVSGGTHGLGMAMATALAQAGATLIVNGHTPGKMEAAAEAYKQKGIHAYTYLFDVCDEAEVERIIPLIEEPMISISPSLSISVA